MYIHFFILEIHTLAFQKKSKQMYHFIFISRHFDTNISRTTFKQFQAL